MPLGLKKNESRSVCDSHAYSTTIAFMSEVEQGLAGLSLNLGLLAQISNGYHIGQSNSPCDTIT